MSKLKPSNPYAFPCEKDEPGKGMTLRDYFAAKAISNVDMAGLTQGWEIEVARRAYMLADAMLKQRQE